MISHQTSMIYYLQRNVQVESINKTLNKILVKLVSKLDEFGM